jgi:predicted adenine nucleotide alpha hydrolase (AANH) superfamily ATPase
MTKVAVLDAKGTKLSFTTQAKARRLVERGRATIVGSEPLTIQLNYTVQIPQPTRQEQEPVSPPGVGRRILLHVCCAPCATFTVKCLRELAFEAVTGCWYNPNVHPFDEHERRRETLAEYAQAIELSIIWEPGYDIVPFMRAIHKHEHFRERCKICYRLRLGRVAQVAAREGFDAFTTTLLISPYQDQDALRRIGDEVAEIHGVEFYFENFRRGWAEHGRMARAHNLYRQRYCGCVYSEWEAQDQSAATLPGRK